jgi:hypothetical protein
MSRKDIEYRPHVWPSVLQAAEWYEGEKAGLGGDFVDELETCFLRISEHPEQFPLAFDVRPYIVPWSIAFRMRYILWPSHRGWW